MQQENKNALRTRLVAVTPAQEELLRLVDLFGPKELKKSLRRVKEHVLYLGDAEVVKEDLDSCYQVNALEGALRKMQRETTNLNVLKS